MVAATYDETMRRVFADEGGYCNDAGDPGGPTKYGITIFDVRMYLKPGATADDVRALTVQQAEDIYRKHYAAPCRYNDEPAGVDYVVIDYGINSGVGRSGKVLRHVVGMPTNTSVITDEVLAAVAKRDPKAIIDAVCDERMAFLRSLGTFSRFGGGWTRRVTGGRIFAKRLAGTPIAAPAAPATSAPAADGTPGKAVHPEPTAAKNVVKGAGGAGAFGLAGFAHWFGAHPLLSLALLTGGVVAVVMAIGYIEQWHQARQVTPMPGARVVPELA